MSTLRDNWRIALLVVLLLASSVALFVPGTPPGASPEDGAAAKGQLTNLQFGIQLSGGTRIRAPVVGMTAEGVDVAFDNESAVTESVADELGLDPIDVRASNETRTVEVFSKNVTESEFRAALEAEGLQPETIRDGVTDETRSQVVDSVDRRITESALSGGSVQEVAVPGGQTFISITAPDRDRGELVDILEERGVVRVYAVYPVENGSHVREQVLDQDEFAGIGTARQSDSGPGVPVTVEASAAEEFASTMAASGFDGQTVCNPNNYNHSNPSSLNGNERCIVATLNGEPVFVAPVTQGLGSSFANGEFVNDPTFVMSTSSMEEAREVELSLKSGRLPAPLDFENDDSLSLDPALAEGFQQNSLITGILAVIAVSIVVYVRYGRIEVAAPMVVTALSEVFLLLGFVSFVQYPLNLSHLAGFIAVIGTGVDDLIIIGDEILQQGDVQTGRVFQSRFRKAFWVIGAAAATTIVAMSPLVVLPLGDLSGFAIITIVGVLLGVLVTRPAYGDILRNLVLDED